MSQRTHLLVGLLIAIGGTAVLGADRLFASADVSTGYGNSMTIYTYVGLGILIIAATWFFLSGRAKPKKEGN